MDNGEIFNAHLTASDNIRNGLEGCRRMMKQVETNNLLQKCIAALFYVKFFADTAPETLRLAQEHVAIYTKRTEETDNG